MRKFGLIICISLAIFGIQSCNSNAPKQGENKTVAIEKVSPNSKLSIEIEGMVCEKGCGSSIRKALKSAGGVASCTLDFEENREKNVATIEFDENKITADKIIDIVTTINERQFAVSKSSSVQMDVKINVKESEVDDESSSENPEINVKTGNFEMPNLIELFSGLLRN